MKFPMLIVALLLIVSCKVNVLTGEVVRVADGDTFTLLVDNDTQVRVRLYGIDCPERGQPYNRVATEHLKQLLAKGDVRVKEMDVDHYGRTIGMVYAGGINVNESLLAAGLAWHYTSFDNNFSWVALEAHARENKVGLWAEPNPVAPWDWRKEKRETKSRPSNRK